MIWGNPLKRNPKSTTGRKLMKLQILWTVFLSLLIGPHSFAQVCPKGQTYSCQTCHSCANNLQFDSKDTIANLPYNWSDPGNATCTVSCDDGSCTADQTSTCSFQTLPLNTTSTCIFAGKVNSLPIEVQRMKYQHSCACVPCNCGCN